VNINSEIEKLKDLQNLTGGYTEVAIENIRMCPFLFLDYLERVDLHLREEEIRIYLIKSKGVKSWFYHKFNQKKINHNLNILGKYVCFWIPKTPILPKINFYWGPPDGD